MFLQEGWHPHIINWINKVILLSFDCLILLTYCLVHTAAVSLPWLGLCQIKKLALSQLAKEFLLDR